MNMHSMNVMNKHTAYAIIGLMVGVFATAGIQLLLAWTGPASTPPNGNVAAPLNVSGTAQVKAGGLGLGTGGVANYLGWPSALEVNGQVKAARFYDDDPNYFLDGNSSSRLNYVEFNNTHSYGYANAGGSMSAGGNMNAQQFVDTNNGNYYSDPNGTSNLYNIQSNNWAAFNTGNVGWAAGMYGPGYSQNAQPQNPSGSIYANDVYLRSVGKYASQQGQTYLSVDGIYPSGTYAVGWHRFCAQKYGNVGNIYHDAGPDGNGYYHFVVSGNDNVGVMCMR